MGRSPRADAVTRSVLLAPLRVPAAGWGSRAIAEQAGVSQSMVARVWREAFPAGAAHPALVGRALRVSAVCVSHANSLVVLTGRGDDTAEVAASMRAPRRPALQTLLAADLARGSRPRGDGGADLERDAAVLRAVAEEGARVVVALTRAPLPDVEAAELVVAVDDRDWQALLQPLVAATAHQPVDDLRGLQLRLMEWSRSRRRRFEWHEPVPVRSAASPREGGVPRSLGDQIAQDAFDNVLARVAAGQLVAGDRVTEASLARGLRTSRAYVREAVRTLASQGLIQLEPHRGAVVPLPLVSDVIDTYDARRAMGSLLVERAATSPSRDLGPAEAALREMLAIAETGDARACGDADLRFQDALADATSMRHVPGMFRTLTSQVLLLTTVMGLRYVYSIPKMCRDDVEILAAVQRRDSEAAIALWQRKIDDALEHMATQL